MLSPSRYAIYALLCGILYVVGLPLGVFVVLYRRRGTGTGTGLGNTSDPFVATTKSKYGFLYEAYGPDAWWWEVEELVRKLLLSAVVVLIEPGSPLQVRDGVQVPARRGCISRSLLLVGCPCGVERPCVASGAS